MSAISSVVVQAMHVLSAVLELQTVPVTRGEVDAGPRDPLLGEAAGDRTEAEAPEHRREADVDGDGVELAIAVDELDVADAGEASAREVHDLRVEHVPAQQQPAAVARDGSGRDVDGLRPEAEHVRPCDRAVADAHRADPWVRGPGVRLEIGDAPERPPAGSPHQEPDAAAQEDLPGHAGVTGAPARGRITTGCVEASMSASDTLPARVRWTGP